MIDDFYGNLLVGLFIVSLVEGDHWVDFRKEFHLFNVPLIDEMYLDGDIVHVRIL